MVTGSGIVVLWSDLGKIDREGKVEMHGTFPNALMPSKLDLSHWEVGEPQRYSEDHEKICGLFYQTV